MPFRFRYHAVTQKKLVTDCNLQCTLSGWLFRTENIQTLNLKLLFSFDIWNGNITPFWYRINQRRRILIIHKTNFKAKRTDATWWWNRQSNRKNFDKTEGRNPTSRRRKYWNHCLINLWISYNTNIYLVLNDVLKSPNRNNPTISSPGISGESKKSGYSLRQRGPNFLPQVFWGFRKTWGKPYIDYMCVLFKVKKVSMDRLVPVNV